MLPLSNSTKLSEYIWHILRFDRAERKSSYKNQIGGFAKNSIFKPAFIISSVDSASTLKRKDKHYPTNEKNILLVLKSRIRSVSDHLGGEGSKPSIKKNLKVSK